MLKRIMPLLALAILCLAAVSVIAAAPDSPTDTYAIPWWTVDGGGRGSVGGPYLLGGTSGQADAQTSSGGIYTVIGGFWNNLIVPTYTGRIYLPVIRK